MTALDDAIARARRQIAREESPVRRRLWLAYRDALEALDADLVAVTRMIVDARAAGIDVSPDWLRRQARYRMLIADAEREFARFADLGIHIVREGQAAAVAGGAHSALELMQAAGVSGAVGFGARINVPAVERLVAALLPGSPVHDVLAGYGPMAAKTIEDALVAGVIEGTGPREVVRTIRRGIASGTNQANIETLVRSQYMDAFRSSMFEQYAAMDLERWQWLASHSSRTCLACLSMSGRTFPMSKRFMAAHPNCFVAGTVVNGPEVEASTKRWYSGEVVDIRFASGDFLTVTPNHPVLTPQGWIAAGALMEGSDVLRCDRPEGEASAINPDYDHRPAFIEDVAEAFGGTIPMTTVAVPTTPMDFHGDGAGSEVSVIRTDRLLGYALQSRVIEPSLQDQFGGAGVGLSFLSRLRTAAQSLDRVFASTSSAVGCFGESTTLVGCPTCREDAISFGASPEFNSTFLQEPQHGGAADSMLARKLIRGHAGEVSLDEVVSIVRRPFAGHVYNLQTTDGWYIANNIITHNCRCIPTPVSPAVTVESGADWFARQPARVQRAMMPSQQAYEAWQRGDVTLDDFRGTRRSRVWGTSYTQRSGSAAIERGKRRAA